MREKLSVRAFAGLLLVFLLAGCTSYRSFRQGQIAAQLGNWDEAVSYYMEALQEDPSSIEVRAALLRAKIAASQEHFEKAKEFKEAGIFDRALIELQQAVQLDSTNQYAEAELRNVREIVQAQRENRSIAGTIQELKDKTRDLRPQPPMLNPRSDEPISLNFPEPVSIFQIYRALGKAFGINILFDPNLKDQEIPIELQDVTAQTALETLMRTVGHFYKVLDEHTVLIAADTPQNRRQYEDLVIQTFFLSNAEVKDMMTILRSLVDAKKIATNEQLNAIILRDTADKVKIAERIIRSNDKAKAEVVVDVELLQIDSTKLRDIGMELSQYSVTQSLDLGGDNVPLRLSDIEFLNQSNWALTIPDFIYQFVKTNTDAQLLAKPRLRITEGEKARLVIGDRVPIPVTTFNTGNTVGGNIVPITSFQYQEVGIQIDLEPRVHHNKEITLKVKVEVSNISGFITGSGGQQQPRIGTRTIDTTIRLKDGEANLLAGLIRTDETQSENGVPGLSEIPLLGRLFSKKRSSNDRTDVLLTLTPHIIRNAEITEEDLLPIWVGTEANLTFRGGSPRVESDIEGPFDAGEGTPEEIQEMMRRRIQRLPRGLRQGQGQETEEQEPPGQELVPAEPPDSFFDDEDDQDLQEEEEEEPPSDLSSAGSGAAAGRAAEPASGGGPEIGQVVFASLASTAEPASEPAARLWITPRALAAAPGDEVVVRLEASAAAPISHLPVTLEYDPEVLEVIGVERGDFLGGAGEAEVMFDVSQPGRLVLGASRLGPPEKAGSVTGSGVVARIRLRAKAAGDSGLVFVQVSPMDGLLQPVGPITAEPGKIFVETGAETPERPERPPVQRPDA